VEKQDVRLYSNLPAMKSFAVSASKWNYWYKIAILNCSCFFLISLLNFSFYHPSINLSLISSSFYFLLSLLIFVKLVMSGGSLAPIAWFILGSGIFFGGGTLVNGFQLCDTHLCQYFSIDLAENISRINILNASASLLVLISASKLSIQNVNRKTAESGSVKWNWFLLHTLCIPIVALVITLNLYYFPEPESFMIRTFLSKLNFITPLFLLLTGMYWSHMTILRNIVNLLLIGCILTIGYLSFSKTNFIVPILVLFSGFWFSRASFLSIVIPGIILVIFYFVILAPLITSGRLDSRYNDTYNTLANRIDIMSDQGYTISDENIDSNIGNILSRFAHGSIQIYMLNQFDAGKPGESLKNLWVSLIPRIFWLEKPDISRFGHELHGKFYSVKYASSALAPTFSAEAYWNYGFIGVLGFSIMIGLQLGWLSNIWFRTLKRKDISFMIVAFPAAFMGFNVEAWIASAYFGGFVTLIILWFMLKSILKIFNINYIN